MATQGDEMLVGERAEPVLSIGPSLSDQAYRALRKMITGGQLQRGERITERALGEQLGVSATPIREAFRRLEHERLIERLDGRNVTVVNPTGEDLEKLNLIQSALRGLAARLAAQSATDEELQRIRAVYEESRAPVSRVTRPDPLQRVANTQSFHDLIDLAAHSPVLVDMISTTTAFDLGERVQPVETLRERYPAGVGLDEHHAILAAITARDGECAEQLMRTHISRTGVFFLGLRTSQDVASASSDVDAAVPTVKGT
jgi:DNA-binding GntR family transcriptional regulator